MCQVEEKMTNFKKASKFLISATLSEYQGFLLYSYLETRTHFLWKIILFYSFVRPDAHLFIIVGSEYYERISIFDIYLTIFEGFCLYFYITETSSSITTYLLNLQFCILYQHWVVRKFEQSLHDL